MIDLDARLEPPTRRRLESLPVWDARTVHTIRASNAAMPLPPQPVDPRVTREDAVATFESAPEVRIRWYRPESAGDEGPCLVYFHGGGYVMGSIEANDDRLDQLALALGCVAVSVDWRLAPEHPYPAGLDDAVTVVRSIREQAERFAIDPDRLVLCGASAGAGIAAATCLRLRELGLPQPLLQVLIYPMIEDRELSASMRALQAGSGHPALWPIEAQRACWNAYLADVDRSAPPPTAVPGRAEDLSGLAPAFVGVGDADPFLGENVDYALRLAAHGVPTELHVYPGVIHGGLISRPDTPRVAQFLRDVLDAIRAAIRID